jgi:hypothetical protein
MGQDVTSQRLALAERDSRNRAAQDVSGHGVRCTPNATEIPSGRTFCGPQAIRNYRKSLALNPNNTNAVSALKALGATP